MIGEPLPNARHEKFAQLIAAGSVGRDAYRKAGFTPKGAAAADVGASRLLRTAKVKARVQEIQSAAAEKTADKAALSKEFVIDMLLLQARRNAGLERVKQTIALKGKIPKGGKRVIEIETTMYDPVALNQTLKLLGLEVGLYKDGSANAGDGKADQEARNKADPKVAEDLDRVRKVRGLVVVGGKDTK